MLKNRKKEVRLLDKAERLAVCGGEWVALCDGRGGWDWHCVAGGMGAMCEGRG